MRRSSSGVASRLLKSLCVFPDREYDSTVPVLRRSDARHVNSQAMLFSYVSPKTRVLATHSLRRIKAVADQVLRKLAPTFALMYSAVGRPLIPPERLLKSEGLIALYSVRSRRLLCERLDTIIWQLVIDISSRYKMTTR